MFKNLTLRMYIKRDLIFYKMTHMSYFTQFWDETLWYLIIWSYDLLVEDILIVLKVFLHDELFFTLGLLYILWMYNIFQNTCIVKWNLKLVQALLSHHLHLYTKRGKRDIFYKKGIFFPFTKNFKTKPNLSFSIHPTPNPTK